MLKFKIGDKVRITSTGGSYHNIPVGTEAVIKQKPEGAQTTYMLFGYCADRDRSDYQSVKPEWFELVEEDKQMKSITYRIIGGTKAVITVDFAEVYEINDQNPNFSSVLDLLRGYTKKYETDDLGLNIPLNEYEELIDLVSVRKRVQTFLASDDRLQITENDVLWDGEPLHGVLVDRILWLMDNSFDAKPLVNFLVNLQANPSYRVREQLFKFLEYGKNAITPDGCFLAYKYVNQDFKSVRDRKTDHSIGTTVSMPREKVDDDPNRTCSAGLHCCSKDYLESYSRGIRIVCVKVNPKNVVAVPTDYNNTKMRCCEYKVIKELTSDEVDGNLLASSPVQDLETKKRPESTFIDDIEYLGCNEFKVTFKSGSVYKYYALSTDATDIFIDIDGETISFSDIYNQYLRDRSYEVYLEDEDSWESSGCSDYDYDDDWSSSSYDC